MGAWGTGIFEDDTALDVRDGYLQLLQSGSSDQQALDELIASNEDQDDPDYQIIFWTALASVQWDLGRLDSTVKQKTLQLMEQGDSPLWEEAEEDEVQERKRVLAELKEKLNSPQPARKSLPEIQAYNRELMGGMPIEDSTKEPDQDKKWWQFWK